jgi:hypothetical protein
MNRLTDEHLITIRDTKPSETDGFIEAVQGMAAELLTARATIAQQEKRIGELERMQTAAVYSPPIGVLCSGSIMPLGKVESKTVTVSAGEAPPEQATAFMVGVIIPQDEYARLSAERDEAREVAVDLVNCSALNMAEICPDCASCDALDRLRAIADRKG